MKAKLTLTLVALAAFALPAAAQTETKVLTGKNLTESALVDALAPADEGIRTRSFKRDQPLAPAKPKSASLLITFETNSADLTQQAKQQLDIVGRALNAEKLAQFKFNIEGHADPRGGAELNQKLSEERAAAVKQYLVQNLNVDAQRLTPIGKGDREPLNEKNPAAPENRRVTIVTVTE
jgi:outer membrane protein OmpA-like peptidoglycan-associated protein